MKIYLIRHGQSEANKSNLHNFPTTKLTVEGIKQAQSIAKRLKSFKIDFIYSSTQTRAFETAGIVSKTLRIPIETWDKIIEVKTPSANWGKPVSDQSALEIEEEIAKNYNKGNWRHSDEETFNETHARAQKVLDHLLKRHNDQNVLCVSHTSFIKMLILTAITAEDLTPNFYRKFRDHSWLHNSGITSVVHTQTHGWVLETWNDISHL